jgi:hypothetical protein
MYIKTAMQGSREFTKTYISVNNLIRMVLIVFTQTFQPYYGPGIDSASNRNEYKKIFVAGNKGQAHKAETLIAIRGPTVCKMWYSRHITNL